MSIVSYFFYGLLGLYLICKIFSDNFQTIGTIDTNSVLSIYVYSACSMDWTSFLLYFKILSKKLMKDLNYWYYKCRNCHFSVFVWFYGLLVLYLILEHFLRNCWTIVTIKTKSKYNAISLILFYLLTVDVLLFFSFLFFFEKL